MGVTIQPIDRKINEIDANIKNGKYNAKKFSEIKTFVQEMTCYYSDDKPVCIQAYEGSPYGFSEFNFYVSEGTLMYSRIEFTELKREYWDSMDTIIFNETNSDITKEQTYFIGENIKLVLINDVIDTLSRMREKTILDQFHELFELSNK
jgi:hypothetical protein